MLTTSNAVLDYNTKTTEVYDKRISNMEPQERLVLASKGSCQEKLALIRAGYFFPVLAKDPSLIVRHALVLGLKTVLERNQPNVILDGDKQPYIELTLERKLLRELEKDISIAVSTEAKRVSDWVEARDIDCVLKEILKRNGMSDFTAAVSKEMEAIIKQKYLHNELEKIPLKNVLDYEEGGVEE